MCKEMCLKITINQNNYQIFLYYNIFILNYNTKPECKVILLSIILLFIISTKY